MFVSTSGHIPTDWQSVAVCNEVLYRAGDATFQGFTKLDGPAEDFSTFLWT